MHVCTHFFLFQNSVVSGIDVRGTIHKQFSFLWIDVNSYWRTSSYGSFSTPLAWRWDPSRWCCLCPFQLQNGSVIRSSARDVTGYFLSSLRKMSCTVSLEVAMDFSCQTFRLVLPLAIVMGFWLWHHSYFHYQIVTEHCKNFRKIPEAFNYLLTVISDKWHHYLFSLSLSGRIVLSDVG